MSLTEQNRDTKTIVAEFRKTSAELSEIIYQDKYSEKQIKTMNWYLNSRKWIKIDLCSLQVRGAEQGGAAEGVPG